MLNGFALNLIAAAILAGGVFMIGMAAIARDPLLPCRALHRLALCASRLAARARRIATALDAGAAAYIRSECDIDYKSRAPESARALLLAKEYRGVLFNSANPRPQRDQPSFDIPPGWDGVAVHENNEAHP